MVAILFFKPEKPIVVVFFLLAFYVLVEMTSRKVALANSGNTLLIWPYYLAFEITIGTLLFKQLAKGLAVKIGLVVFLLLLAESIFNLSPYLTGSKLAVSLFFIGFSVLWFFQTLKLTERKIERLAMFWICTALLAYHLPSLLYQAFDGGYIKIPQDYALTFREARRGFNVLSKLLLTVGICLGLK